jgi:hypothetical protein
MRQFLGAVLGFALLSPAALAQNPAGTAAKPDQHVLGTIVTADLASHTITVKADKTDTQYTISLAGTRTLLKVAPGAKDLKSATRITADDLAVGDRVDVRGFKAGDNPTSIAAASLLLMSARDIQQAHQAEMTEWRQRGVAGTVTSVDPAAPKLNVNVRTPDGPTSLVVDIPAGTQFTRYSPENPKTPAPSQLSDIHPGDQVRILGNRTPDGSALTAEKIYSGSFRTVAGTISSISPEGKKITLTDLQTKQPVQIVLSADSAIRKLPPQMAMMMARRGAEQPSSGANRAPARSGGDISQMIERVPKISASDLKPGDAVVVSGAAGANNSQLVATNIIAGVEPIFQSAPPRQGGRSPGGDWSLDMAIPAQ